MVAELAFSQDVADLTDREGLFLEQLGRKSKYNTHYFLIKL
jgi:hypothetical protein